MKLFKCPHCGKPSVTWRFFYKPVTLEGIWSRQGDTIAIQPPLVVRNSTSPEEAITDNKAVIVCPKCGEEATFSMLDELTICDIRRTAVPTVERYIEVAYRHYGSPQPARYTIRLDVDETLDEETIARLLAVD